MASGIEGPSESWNLGSSAEGDIIIGEQCWGGDGGVAEVDTPCESVISKYVKILLFRHTSGLTRRTIVRTRGELSTCAGWFPSKSWSRRAQPAHNLNSRACRRFYGGFPRWSSRYRITALRRRVLWATTMTWWQMHHGQHVVMMKVKWWWCHAVAEVVVEMWRCVDVIVVVN